MVRDCNSATHQSQEEMAVRKGPWTAEEDSVLFNYVNINGEGNWNSVARSTGLKRSGKSCRLRWLNYLRPSVRRGNITLQEQLLILELHFRWGNRWSKIAQFLPGRTDNEIKNYWRTRVQKQAKQLNCDVNSQQFRDAMRFEWMPRLLERIQTSAEHKPTFSDDPTSGFTVEDPNSVVTSYNSSELELRAPSVLDYAETERCDLQNSGGSPSGSGVTEWESDIQGWFDGGDSLESFLNDENIRFLRQQLCDDEF